MGGGKGQRFCYAMLMTHFFELVDFAKGRDHEEVAPIRYYTELDDVIIKIP